MSFQLLQKELDILKYRPKSHLSKSYLLTDVGLIHQILHFS